MPTIKFSHAYPKLWGQATAVLIAIKDVYGERLPRELIEYDTKTVSGEYYKLPKGRLIQLIFYGDKGIPFCTIRRFTPQKLEYYKGLLKQEFEIIITGE